MLGNFIDTEKINKMSEEEVDNNLSVANAEINVLLQVTEYEEKYIALLKQRKTNIGKEKEITLFNNDKK